MHKAPTKPTRIVPGRALGVVPQATSSELIEDRMLRSSPPKSLQQHSESFGVTRASVPASASAATSSAVGDRERATQLMSLSDRVEAIHIEKTNAEVAHDLHDRKRGPQDPSAPSPKASPPKRQAPPFHSEWQVYGHGHDSPPSESKDLLVCDHWWTPERKKEAFSRIRFNLENHLEVGFVEQRTELAKYLSEERTQGLYVTGSSPESTNFLLRAILRSLSLEAMPPETVEIVHVDAEFYNTPSKVYDVIRGRLKCRWDFPRWRSVKEYVKSERTVPPVNPAVTSVVVVENIDAQIKSLTSKLATLDDLLRYLNMHVRDRGLKVILTGHDAKTVRRFSTTFGGFISTEADKYVYRIPGWTFKSLATRLELVAENALVPMGNQAHLSDVIATQAFQLASQKALKHGRCEVEPVVMVIQKAIRAVLTECRHLSIDCEAEESKWRVDYKHVAAAATVFFEHDYVSRIRCLGTYPKALLLVLIDAGPCTEEELIHHVNERQKNHAWILILTSHNREWFNTSLDLLLYVPVVKVRDTVEFHDDACYARRKYYALPSREHLIAAAGSEELIKLIL